MKEAGKSHIPSEDGRTPGYADAAAFNAALDTDVRLRAGLERLNATLPEVGRETFAEELLLLFEEAGIFLTRSELERLLAMRRELGCMALDGDCSR